MYSQQLSSFYDALMGENPHLHETVKQLVAQYVTKRGKVLELGCGTGTMLKELERDYELTGLDIAPGMIEIAKKKVPTATYYIDDMSAFTLPKKFDAILCLFDSINHLTDISQWEGLFKRAHKHLKKNGVFIFDMNTLYRLNGLSTLPTHIQKIGKSTLSTARITKVKRNLFYVKFQVFDRINSSNIAYFEESVFETGISIQRVKKILQPTFRISEMIDPFRPSISKDTGRIFFVCRPKNLPM